MKKIFKGLLATGLAISMLSGCSSNQTTDTNQVELEEQTIIVAAAASLQNAYENDLIPMFNELYSNVTVSGVYDGSGKLKDQIIGGLDADVFMSADTKNMDALTEEDYINTDTRVDLLENKIVLIVPNDSDLGLKSFEDLANLEDGKIIALGDPESVPAGTYAKESLTNLNVWDSIQDNITYAGKVTEVLEQVASGNADCGIVYSTDALSNDKVTVICEAPADSVSKAIYPVAILKNTKHSDAASAFLEFLQSDEALAIFEKYGFTINK